MSKAITSHITRRAVVAGAVAIAIPSTGSAAELAQVNRSCAEPPVPDGFTRYVDSNGVLWFRACRTQERGEG